MVAVVQETCLQVPVIDLFAGPGGLGEGFSRCLGADGKEFFRLAASFEKDRHAHQTLELRAFYRELARQGNLTDYWEHVTGKLDRETLFSRHPQAADIARSEANLAELGSEAFPTNRLRATIRKALGNWSGPLVVVGGPPCQAYSIVGRARRKGIADYRPEEDHRTTLYKEYLQVLADWQPSVFVMENVRGILSSRLNGERIFPRILTDLENPAAAIRRDGRTSLKGRCRYRIHSLVCEGTPDSPEGWVVRAEDYGIPQCRHRVILLGIREDLESSPAILEKSAKVSVREAISDLPALRAAPTGKTASPDAWLRCVEDNAWHGSLAEELLQAVKQTLAIRSSMPDPGTGGIRKPGRRKPAKSLEAWLRDTPIPHILNHEARPHMPADLQRYLFASLYGSINKSSPRLGDFPKLLLPKHRNAEDAVSNGTFDDRFRVQLADAPATTVTSHISKDGHYFIHHDPVQCRSWSIREAARIQTFPDSYFFCGNRTAQYSQVGNAVPPLLAWKIAGIVKAILQEEIGDHH